MRIALFVLAAVILLAILATLLIPVRTIVSFYKNPTGSGLEIAVKIGFIKFKLHPSEKKPKKKKSKKKSEKPKEKKPLKGRIQSGIDLYGLIADDAKYILSYTAKNSFCIENLSFHLLYGTGDAASTGILYGVISGLVYGLVGAVSNSKRLKKSDIIITPDFTASAFDTSGECIARLRNVHIIVIAVKLFKLLLKIKKGKERD